MVAEYKQTQLPLISAIVIIIIIIINLYLYTKPYYFYMVFLGIVCKISLKYSKELLNCKVKNTKTYFIIRVIMSHGVLR